jgi:DNA-binding MarR family transcriptional regulator
MVTTSPGTDVATRLRLAITRTARRLRQEAGEDLSPSLAAALATVERHGPLAPSRLAEIERVKRPTATRILTRLEEAGLVERERDPRDGRGVLVTISDEGRRTLRRMRSRKTAYLARRLRELPPEDAELLDRAADVLDRLLREERA